MICGYPFIWNGTPSELYGVSLVFLNENYTNRPSGSGVEIDADEVMRNPKVLYLSGRQAPQLEFGIEVVFDDPVDIFVLTQVKDWLGGEVSFKHLQICAEYFNSFYFNCYIELNEDLIYNGGYRGVSATVHCDSPWAWEFEKMDKYAIDPSKETTIIFNNLSADSEMLRPILTFRTQNSGNFSITNKTTNKTTTFTGLNANETVSIDNLYGFIESDTGLLRVSNFNKVFFQLAKGLNELVIAPNCNYLIIQYQNAKRIGGGYY